MFLLDHKFYFCGCNILTEIFGEISTKVEKLYFTNVKDYQRRENLKIYLPAKTLKEAKGETIKKIP